MDALHELTVIIEDLNRAGSFKGAAQRITSWARDFTGCEAAILRLRGESEGGPWLAVCALDGPSTSFVRDETMVGETGYHDPSLPGDDRLVLAIRLDGVGGAGNAGSNHGEDSGGDRGEEA